MLVDIGVLGQVWWNPRAKELPPAYAPEAYVDFYTEHKCRNFDDVRSWAEKHQMPVEVPNDWLQPPREGDRIYDEIP
jgi:Mycotoxin biosynthesis protein UstYa